MKIFHVIWGQLVVALVTFASIRAYTELMDADAFGAAMLGLGVIALFESLVSMALSQTQVALCAKLASKEERRQLSVGLACLLLMLLSPIAFSVAAVSLGLSFIWPAALDIAIVAIALLGYFAGEAVKHSLLSLLMLDQRFRRQSAWIACEALLTFVGIGVTLLFLAPTAWNFLAAHIAMRVASSVIFVAVFGGRSHLRGIRLHPARARWRKAVAHGLPVSAMGPLGWMSSFLDRFIIAAVLGTGATGTYVAATGLVGRPYALTTSVLSNYFRPQLFTAGEDETGRRRIILRWLSVAAAIGLAGVLALILVGPFILPLLLAAEYRKGAVALMASFALAQTLAIMTHALDNTLLASGRSAGLLKLQAVMSLSTLAIIPAGTILLGPLGATFARCIAEALKLIATGLLVADTPFAKPKAKAMETGMEGTPS